MSEENVNVCFYKKRSNFNEFYKIIGKMPQVYAADLTKELLTYPVDDSDCVSPVIKITSTTLAYRTPDGMKFDNDLIISDFYSNEMKFPCIDDTKEKERANMDSYNRISYCYNNLSTGKCKCNFFTNTIGKYMYPQYYGKVK